ncbi:AraC-like DNA-binding protein [Pedobacter sp. UYP30]|uniref:AraC family transcriptional regulator n=1 Tax=Pedobacter sp. UYP30 TaxID=1756400 RepID=UPI003395A35F
MINNDIAYQFVTPDKSLSDFVERIWMLQNHSDSDKEVVILPDGSVDLFFTRSLTDPFHCTLLGIGTQPEKSTIKATRTTFAISFKPLSVEYILKESISELLNKAKNLANDFWGFTSTDLEDFDLFSKKATQQIKSILPKETDHRKHKLFDLIYNSNGALSVAELSEKVFWGSRQMNRYFNQQYGISLKTYCNIVRFRASFGHLKEGILFPQQNFSDQAHFIREVRKLAGVNPKQLVLNQNDRFIQFSTLPED